MPSEALAHQPGGSHYIKYPIQPVMFIAANEWDFFAGNILKYLVRWQDKNGFTDLKKAQHYRDIRKTLHTQKRNFCASVIECLKQMWVLRKFIRHPELTMVSFVLHNKIDGDIAELLFKLERWINHPESYFEFSLALDEYVEKQSRAHSHFLVDQ